MADGSHLDWMEPLPFEEPSAGTEDWFRRICAPSALVFCNEIVGVEVKAIMNGATGLDAVVAEVFNGQHPNYTVTLWNQHEATRSFCPAFTLMCSDLDPKTVVNYKLQTFLALTGNANVTSRSAKVLVVGRQHFFQLEPLVDVPFCFQMSNWEQLTWTEADPVPQVVINLPVSSAFPFELMAPCKRCCNLKTVCSRLLGCAKCVEGTCEPSFAEPVHRARITLANLGKAIYYHNDHAKYQIHLQHRVLQKRSFLRKPEQVDLETRLRVGSLSMTDIAPGDLASLPNGIKLLTRQYTTYKIEWMFDGPYFVYCSNDYSKDIIDGETIKDISSKCTLPPKLVDYVNLSKGDLHYRLWCESLNKPGMVRQIRADCFLKSRKTVTPVEVVMCSYIVTSSKLISFTAITRVNSFTVN